MILHILFVFGHIILEMSGFIIFQNFHSFLLKNRPWYYFLKGKKKKKKKKKKNFNKGETITIMYLHY